MSATHKHLHGTLLVRIGLGGVLAAIVIGVLLPVLFAMRRARTAPVDEQAAERRESSLVLLRALRDQNQRMAEVQRLVATGRTEAARVLADFAREPGEPAEFRLACIRALGKIGDAVAAHTLSGLAESHRESREIRLAAIMTLGEMKCDFPLSYLAVVLTKEDDDLRLAAVRAVAQRPGDEAVEMLAGMLADHSAAVREAAVAAITKNTSPAATAQLICALHALDPKVRLAAVEELGRREGAAVRAAVARAMSDKDEAVQAAAARAVRAADAAALDAMLAGVGPKSTVAARLEIAQAIRRSGEIKHAGSLLRLLDDLPRQELATASVAALRQEVLDGLLAMGEEVLEPVLTAALEGECDPPAEQVAAEVCRRLGKKAVAPIVAGILKWKLFPDPRELKMWIEVLGDLGDATALAAMNRALAQDIPGMEAVVEAARAKIAQRSGTTLPPCVPDKGILFEAGDPARAHVPLPPPAFHLPEHPDSAGLPDNGVVRFVLRQTMLREIDPPAPMVKPSFGNWKRVSAGGEGGAEAATREATEEDESPDPPPPRRGGLYDLELEVRRKNGQWQPEFIAYAPNYNKRNHLGRVVGNGQLSSGEVQLKIEICVLDDQYVAGGYGEYELTFPGDRAQFAGRYRGHFNFDHREGELAGGCWKVDWNKPDYPPIAAGEHPRLLCRQFQFEPLREKARTPFGRKVLWALRTKLAAEKRMFQQRVDWVNTWVPGMHLAVGHGLLAHLFDDPEHGRRAAALVMERTTTVPYGGEHGERIPGAWLSSPYGYDMAYNFLTETEREKANEFFGRFSDNRLFTPAIGCVGNLNHRGVYEVPGLTALSLLGEKGRFRWVRPSPPPPAAVFAGEPGAAPVNDSPENEVPINDVRPGKLIAKWLFIGPVVVEGGAWPLAAIGKPEDIRAKRGLPVQVGGGRYEFQPLPAECIRDTPRGGVKKQAIVLPRASQGDTHYLYCELDTKQAQGGVLDWRHFLALEPSRLWLNGQELQNGAYVVLQPGRHRLLVEMKGSAISPYLMKGNAWRAVGHRKRYQWEYALWEEAHRRHEQTGIMTDMEYSLHMCRHVFRDHLRRLAEEARANGHYVRGSLMLAAAVRMSCAEDLFIDTPAAYTATPYAALPYLSAEELCMGLGLTPKPLLPELVREFDHRYLPDKLDKLDCILLAATLVNYPLSLQPMAPKESVPRMLANRAAFNVSFLAGQMSDVQCQVVLREEQPRLLSPEVYLPRAGALLLRGLDSNWITTGPAQGRPRFEAVVEVSGISNDGPCRVRKLESDPAGTALLDLDMSPIYGHKEGAAIEARRQVAVDYSGRSGAAALLVLYDRLRGPGKKTWTLPCGVRYIEYGGQLYYAQRVVDGGSRQYVVEALPLATSEVDSLRSNEFAFHREVPQPRRPLPVLRGVILKPEKYELHCVPTATKGSQPVLQLSTEAEEAEFLVVLTLQQAPIPPVTFHAEESVAMLTVGKQTLKLHQGTLSWGQ